MNSDDAAEGSSTNGTVRWYDPGTLSLSRANSQFISRNHASQDQNILAGKQGA